MAASHRLTACRAVLLASGLDGLVGFAGRIHNFLVAEPVFTLTGFRGVDACAIVLMPDAAPVLIVTPAWDAARAARIAPQALVVPSDDLIASVAAVLAEIGTAKGRIGIAGLDLLPVRLAHPAQALVGADAVPFDTDLRRLGRTKSEDEIADAIAATRIAEDGYAYLLDVLRPGMTEYELNAELYCYMKALGSEDNFLLMSSSQHNHAVRTPLSRVLAEGDVVLVELTPCVNGQFSQICRSVHIGSPPDLLLEQYAILEHALGEGLAAARSGSAVAVSAKAMNDVFRAHGYGQYCRPPYMRVRGHGLGLISDLPGDVDEDNDMVLEDDMVFVIHPNQYLPETGYLMCGEPVRIRPEGAQMLTRQPGRLDHVAA